MNRERGARESDLKLKMRQGGGELFGRALPLITQSFLSTAVSWSSLHCSTSSRAQHSEKMNRALSRRVIRC